MVVEHAAFLFGLVGAETQDLQHFAEFGVVLMLFLIGRELKYSKKNEECPFFLAWHILSNGVTVRR